ncbi:MAG: anthranilate phosphoribosyltransferase [Phycisphaerae bacterium]|nr:anthranilate phosphoribosyltransferase [Phycisphaerae bacterium]
MGEPTYKDMLRTVMGGAHLAREQSEWAFGQIMDGLWSEAQVAGLLTALAIKGESVDEIAGAAAAMRDHVVPIDTGGADVVDTCGTGGTGLSTFNISTAAAMVLAGAGVTVAKHGNRTNTRASGSANVLEALGVNLDATPETVGQCLREAGVCFCFAIRCHPAMKHAAPVRKQLAVRTIFNLLGPLTNPAAARRQLMGVFDADLTETIAEVLGALGAIRAMVVHADDGLDELSTTSATKVSEFRDGAVTTRRVHPEDFGLAVATLDDLLVDSAEASADRIRRVLAGETGPDRDIVLLNAAAALAVAGKAETIGDGLTIASESVDSGAAATALDALVRMSNA